MSKFGVAYSMKKKMAKGGSVAAPAEPKDEGADMVHRILKRCYSEGGKVANGGDSDPERMAGSAPNNFDDLALRDDLEFNYTGANSGDELGNEQLDSDDSDIVKRARKSWAKKDKNPKPA